MEEKIIEIKNVNKGYRLGDDIVPVLKNIDFTVKKGEFVAILGPSGSGKTTLMNIIGCMDVLDSGEYYLNGRAIHNTKESEMTEVRNKEIGFIFQNYNLVPMLNVYQNMILPVELDAKHVDRDYMQEIIHLLHLDQKLFHLPNNLSGGQQQRVAIARALVGKPAVILADEPTGNLDRKNSRDVMALLTKASRQYQQTILMITHNPNLISSVDRVMQVSDGILTDLGGHVNEKLS